MEDEIERTLRKEIPNCLLSRASDSDPWDPAGLNGWGLPTIQGANTIPVWEGTIDLSGYAKDFKTFYPHGGFTQRGPYTSALASLGAQADFIIDYTIVSSVPLDPTSVFAQLLTSTGPGFMGYFPLAAVNAEQNQNWETITFAEAVISVPNQNISPNVNGMMQTMDVIQSGSLSATAADTLHVMRMIVDTSGTALEMVIPASRVVLPGVMGQEPDLEYIMRLSRSIEHLSTLD